ncbi:MAG: hypothetical protein LCH96_16760 [Actinobacteria bacterium]|nr:hypothetical protein [Actinomycetota bacterium]
MPLTQTASASSATDKGFFDFLGSVLPSAAGAAASAFGLDPRVAGQTVSQVMGMFGLGKDFVPAVAKDQALAELKGIVGPHLADPTFNKALGLWMQAAVEPIQASKEGKAYQPSVDLSKSWFSDAWDTVSSTVSDVASSVDWGKVTQVGMQALPYVIAAL